MPKARSTSKSSPDTSQPAPASVPAPAPALPEVQPAPQPAPLPEPEAAVSPAAAAVRHYRRIAPGDVSRLAVPYVVVGHASGSGEDGGDVVVDVFAKDAKKLPGTFLADTLTALPSALRRHVEEVTYREDETGIVRRAKAASIAEGTVLLDSGLSPHEWLAA